jgi:flagellar motility protein MotE (MotC chaperone)
MMRIVGIAIAAIIVFLAAVLVPLALNGKLNAGTIKKLSGVEEKPAPPPDVNENLSPLTVKIKEEQERLHAWEKDLQDREDRLDQREELLDQTLAEVTKAQAEVKAGLGQLDEQHAAALQQIAKTMEKMEPTNAAIDLAAMSPEDAAKIVPLISDRNRGKILDEMQPKPRSELLSILQAKKL